MDVNRSRYVYYRSALSARMLTYQDYGDRLIYLLKGGRATVTEAAIQSGNQAPWSRKSNSGPKARHLTVNDRRFRARR